MWIEVQWKDKRGKKNAVFTRKKPGLPTMSVLRRASSGIPNTSMNYGLAVGLLGKQHELDGGDLISSWEDCCAGRQSGEEHLMPVSGCVGAGCASQQPTVSKTLS